MILITTPHSVCEIDNLNHLCDSIAKKSALALKASLSHMDVQYLEADKYRGVVDLNRDISIKSRYRRKLTQLMKLGKVDLLLDIHSFPGDDTEWKYNDIVLLTTDSLNNLNDCIELSEMLNFNGIISLVIYGTHNSIIEEAERNGILSILIEFNESLDDIKIKYIANIIVSWINSILRD